MNTSHNALLRLQLGSTPHYDFEYHERAFLSELSILNYSKPWMVIRGSEGVHSQPHSGVSISVHPALPPECCQRLRSGAGSQLTQIQERQMQPCTETVSWETAILEQATCNRNAFISHFQACRRSSEKLKYSLLSMKGILSQTSSFSAQFRFSRKSPKILFPF
ncbi:hypothetical protein CEXT_68911 [Caerostris extrusa]|uniref:Uncharacterized protein n=1 Tax=Caerostris extrusa TaxID=172846 RepID=A0AAV4TDX7_CAEEX|nr:hypothetical protein CEXT_68911 [Caerostris extrusa]